MAHKTARRKFRPPLKEGASLPCSQTSSTSGLVEGSQERGAGREGSQSWLSQLTTTDDSVSKEPAVTAKFSTAKVVPLHEAVGSKNGLFSMDDSLCSIGVENEKPSNGDAPEDSLSGNDGIISPGIPLHQVTQTHTVLSFCSEDSTPVSELQRESETAAMGKFQIVKYAAEPTVDIYNDLVDAAMEGDTTGNLKEPMSRFQHKSKPSARSYDYSKILPRFGPQRAKSKKGSKNNNSKTRTKKSVTLVVNQGRLQSKISTSAVTDAGHQDTTAKGDLSVYDYQPTPQQEEGEEEGDEREETSVMNNSNWISKRTREEQASINVHVGVLIHTLACLDQHL